MSYKTLGVNIKNSLQIVKDLKKMTYNLKYSSPDERDFYLKNIYSLISRLKMICSSIPSIVDSVSVVKNRDTPPDIIRVSYNIQDQQDRQIVSIKKEDRDKFLKELSLYDKNINKIKKLKCENKKDKTSGIVRISNKMFGGMASRLKGSLFEELRSDLKKSNSKFLLNSYLSISLFFSFLMFIVSLVVVIVFFIFNFSAILFLWAPFVSFFVCFVAFYIAPSIKKGSIDKNIYAELPFAVIYMSAISGVNADPTKIFKLIADSGEYPTIGIEMGKVVSQIEIYGYDLVSALRNVSKATINEKLSQLLNGIAINISSGSSLKNFLEKESENLLLDYKLDREKYSSVAATFMDVYISVLITAPLILVMLIVIMDITGLSIVNLPSDILVMISIAIVALVNIMFLIFIQIKQPKT